MSNNTLHNADTPNDPSSPTPGQKPSDLTETQSRRSVQRMVRPLDIGVVIYFTILSMPYFPKTGIFLSLWEMSPFLGLLHFGLSLWGLLLLLRILGFLCLAAYSKYLSNKNTSSLYSLGTRSELLAPNKEEK